MSVTKGVKICLAVAVAIFVVAAVAVVLLHRPAESTWVEITQDGKVLYTLDLSTFDDETTQTIRIDSPDGGYNIIEIGDGNTIRISEADCPDQTCVNMGRLKSDYLPIVCLPHKLIVRFAEDQS